MKALQADCLLRARTDRLQARGGLVPLPLHPGSKAPLSAK